MIIHLTHSLVSGFSIHTLPVLFQYFHPSFLHIFLSVFCSIQISGKLGWPWIWRIPQIRVKSTRCDFSPSCLRIWIYLIMQTAQNKICLISVSTTSADPTAEFLQESSVTFCPVNCNLTQASLIAFTQLKDLKRLRSEFPCGHFIIHGEWFATKQDNIQHNICIGSSPFHVIGIIWNSLLACLDSDQFWHEFEAKAGESHCVIIVQNIRNLCHCILGRRIINLLLSWIPSALPVATKSFQ